MQSLFNIKNILLIVGCCLLPTLLSAQDRISISLENWEKFHNNGQYDKAIEQAEQAFLFAEQAKQKEAMAIALNRIGLSLIKKPKRVNKNRKLAKEKFERSLFYLASINNIDLRLDNLERLRWLAEMDKDQEHAAIYDNQIRETKNLLAASAQNEALIENTENLETKVNQLAVQKQVLTNRVETLNEAQLAAHLVIALQKNQVDSMGFELAKDSLLLQQKELRLAEQATTLNLQQSQLDLQNSQRNFFLALTGIVGLLAIGAFMRYIETKKYNAVLEAKNELIETEKKKSEQLLLNILPAVVANELKTNGTAKARKYENATVLFSDFKNFSAISKSLSPERLVHELDFYFKTFDSIISNYKLEKIKTIGDAYMCVAGLPEEDPNNPLEMVKAALEIQSYLTALKIEREEKGEPFFEARIGIHTGPLVAGVVGSKKFAFDVWGDTVNVAARLESKSEAGKVNISASTYQHVKEEFECQSRGKIPVKNRGEIEMYYVEGLAV